MVARPVLSTIWALLLALPLVWTQGVEASTVRIQRSSELPVQGVVLALVGVSSEGRVLSMPGIGVAVLDLKRLPWVGEVPVPDGACLVAWGRGVWSQPACPTDTGYRVELLPGAAFLLRLEGDGLEGDRLPDDIINSAWRRDVGEQVTLPCRRETEEAIWNCTGPVGPMDLRIALPGFAPNYLWNVEVDPTSPIETLTARVVRGASVDGWVDGPSGETRLRPAGRRREEPSERLRFVQREEAFDRDGHFRFDHVGPGIYELEVESPGRAVYWSTLEVGESDDRVVLQEISLQTLRRVEVSVDPPLDGFAEPWTVQLSEAGQTSGDAPTLKLDLTGWAVAANLTLGEYLVIVTDSRGSVWHLGRHEIDESGSLMIGIPRVEVEGSISAGGAPVETSLIFGTTQGSKRIILRSDDRGRFEGFLPREGRWEVEMGSREAGCGTCEGELGVVVIPPVDVEVGPGGRAFVDIRLPDTKLRGRVVRQTGQEVVPVPGARLLVVRVEGERERRGRKVQLWTEDDGTFDIRGLEPGPVRVAAVISGGSGESDWVRVDLLDGVAPPDLELTIREKVPLSVSLTAAGQPVAGARVIALPEEGLSVDGVTDPDGRSTLRVPEGSAGPLLIESIGRGVWLGRFQAAGIVGAGESALGEVHVDLAQAPGDIVLEGVSAVPLPSWLEIRGGVVSLNVVRSLLPAHVEASNGKLLLKDFSPGRYSLCLWQSDRCSEVAIPPGGRASIQRSLWEEEGDS